MLKVTVLVSVGQHPVSGRSRRADADARAVEMALSIPNAEVSLIHAGDASESALREYLGMGIASLTVLALEPGMDALPLLGQHLDQHEPDLILMGVQAESGEDSGLLPYALAKQLGRPVLPSLAQLEVTDRGVSCLQALPRGRRRQLAAELPLLVTVSSSAPQPRLSAYGPARRGQIEELVGETQPDHAPEHWQQLPARMRPKRLMSAASSEDYLSSLIQTDSAGGSVVENLLPEEAAQKIFDYLVAESILKSDGSAG